MSKKKDENKKEENEAKKIADELNKEMKDLDGFTVIEEGEENKSVERVPTGIPELDHALGGGLGKGRIIELYGTEGSGKTWIASKTYATNQAKGVICAHFDLECSYDLDYAKKNGVILSKLLFKQFGEKDYAESVFTQIEKLCKTKKIGIIGIDSVAALVPKDVLEGSYEDKTIGMLARVLSSGMSKISSIAKTTGTTIIFINQIREKIGGGWSPNKNQTDTPGGRALKFYASQRINVNKLTPNKTMNPDLFNNEDEPIGHVARIKVEKNKLSIPFKKCDVVLRYEPLPTYLEIVDKAMKSEIIEKNKSNHKKLSFKEVQFSIEEKNNYQMIWDELKKNNIVIDVIYETQMDYLIPSLIDNEIITEEEIEEYQCRSSISEDVENKEKEPETVTE